MRVLRVLAAVLVAGVFGVLAGGACASSVSLCVPSTAGGSVTSGACSRGGTTVALPASSADQQTLLSILPHISFSASGIGGKPTITFSGVNVQIIDGSGHTSTVNGTGNLVLGYDETPGTPDRLARPDPRGEADVQQLRRHPRRLRQPRHRRVRQRVRVREQRQRQLQPDRRRSEHRLGHRLEPAGRLQEHRLQRLLDAVRRLLEPGRHRHRVGVQPCSNTTSYNHDFASISGGSGNQTTGITSSVTGGQDNLASDPFSSVTGGCEGVAGAGTPLSGSCNASGLESVGGGFGNIASGLRGFAAGGSGNTATGFQATALGGFHNKATFPAGGNGTSGNANMSSLGGAFNVADGDTSSITGGCDNLAGQGSVDTGTCSAGVQSVTGGYQNVASGAQSSVTGGQSNLAADPLSSISGGCGNWTLTGATEGAAGQPNPTCNTTGVQAILGGFLNIASGRSSSVSGGEFNLASGPTSSVTGGDTNTASFDSNGGSSTVTGGSLNTASGTASTVLGGNGNTASGDCQAIPAAPIFSC